MFKISHAYIIDFIYFCKTLGINVIQMKKIFLLTLISLFAFMQLCAQSAELDALLIRLDSVLMHTEEYVKEKEMKIKQLRMRKVPSDLEEKFWFNKMLYDEYYVYNADTAMTYVVENIQIAQQLNKQEWEQEWRLNRVFLLVATGLLYEAETELKQIDENCLPLDLQLQYYDRKIYLYSHLGQYVGKPEYAEIYYQYETKLKEEAQKIVDTGTPSYYWFKALFYRDFPESEEYNTLKKELRSLVERSSLDTCMDAMNSYVLARMYMNEGDEDNYMRYLIYSSIADVRICNRDIASMEELSSLLYKRNDIDRGYTYINYCLKMALQYPNRVRVVGISTVLDKLHQAYQERNIQQERRLKNFLYIVSILSVVLLVAVCLIYIQFRKLAKSRARQNETNKLLNSHVEELSEAYKMLAEVNDELSSVNEQLKTSNNQLLEANYVKEEYIGYVFSICSSYISKLEEYRKNVSRKLKAGQIEELKSWAAGTSIVQSELKEFYHSFDAIFLHVYPDFVEDFNALLRPEERVTLKEGELLNTELRIYALVRLGINDSVKIAEFLHCSPQTVYNNRLRTRNKALILKENFAEVVRSLGKMQR